MAGETSSSSLKWLVGILIAVAAAGGGITAWLKLIHPAPEPSPACDIAGHVYALNDEKPIPAVGIEYDGGSGKYVHAATTGIDGSFKFNCSDIKKQTFPLKLRLTRHDWSTAAAIQDEVNRNDEELNFFVEAKQGIPPIVYLRRIPPRLVSPPPAGATTGPSSQGSNKNAVVVGPPSGHR